MATLYGAWSSKWKPSGANEYRHFRSVMNYSIWEDATNYYVYVESGVNLDYTVNASFGCGQDGNGNVGASSAYGGSKTYIWQSRTYTYAKTTYAYNIAISASVWFTGSESAWKGDSSATTLWATVPARAQYTLSYDANGGAGAPANQSGFYGIGFPISGNVPTRVAHDFKKWGNHPTSPTAYFLPNQNIALTANTTLYAVWEDVGVSPSLTFGELEDTVMTAWTKGHSVAKVTVEDATVQSIATLSKITLSLVEIVAAGTTITTQGFTVSGVGDEETGVVYKTDWNNPTDFPHDMELSVTATGRYNVVLSAVDSLGYEVEYQLASVTVAEPKWTTGAVSFEGTFPSVDQDGYAMATFYAKNKNNSQYEELTDKYTPIKIDDTHWKIVTVLDEKYITVATGAVDLKVVYSTTETTEKQQRAAFFTTSRQANFSNGLANNLFVGGSGDMSYQSRIWYSALNNPLYFPDLNYIEVGSNDTAVMGLTKVGDYLGVIKQSKPTDTSVYLVYPTSFEDNTTYAVKQSIAGIGAASKYGFNVLGDETLFLSDQGIMAIDHSEDVQHKIQLRSFYINKKLLAESNIENAYSFVWQGMYILAINGNAYILDGNQKVSWETQKTNLQYEAYYWENVPAKCFMKYYRNLLFCDESNVYTFGGSYADNGIPVTARWSTVLDNDNASQYFKTLQKKGNVVTLLADEDGTSAKVFFKKDAEEKELVKTIDSVESDVPVDIFPKKKMKKYKRLQVVAENDQNEFFGVSEIVKSYALGNYSK